LPRPAPLVLTARGCDGTNQVKLQEECAGRTTVTVTVRPA